MDWFRKRREKAKDLPTAHLFKPYPETLALAFVRPVLMDMARNEIHRDVPPDLRPIPDSFETPYGHHKYVGASKLALIPIVCIKETGAIIQVRVREIYVDHIMANLAAGLNLDFESFLKTITQAERTIIAGVEGVGPPRLMYSTVQEAVEAMSGSQQSASSKPGIVADKDSSLYSTTEAWNPLRTPTGEYRFSYWTTTTDAATGLNLTSLEITVKSCLDDNLSAIPPGGGWESNFLKPLFTHIRAELANTE